ncbi:hypothetical protein H4W33_005231 [Kibdelosporangium phytohabitans]|nr:hypothetical protein [Kibdelosporangium phytohabitans]
MLDTAPRGAPPDPATTLNSPHILACLVWTTPDRHVAGETCACQPGDG